MSLAPAMKLAAFLSLWLLAPGALLHAEAPKLESLFPAGGQAGSSFTLAATGKLDDNVRLWTDAPGLYLVPTGKKNQWQATLTAQAQSGLHLVYAVNDDGVSGPRWFSTSRLPELAETESNNEPGNGQLLAKLPVCINARLGEKGDVDNYRVALETGQTLVALVEAYALGSPVDILAHVLNPEGQRVLTASDGRNLDPVFVYKAEKAGIYTVQIAGFIHPPAADVRFTGGPAVVYRLHLSTGPVVTGSYPAAVAKTGKTEVELVGYNLDPKKLKLTAEASMIRGSGNNAVIFPPDAIQPVQVLATGKPATLEKEPNNSADQATPVEIGTVAGLISAKTDVDRFVVTQKKGEKLQARLYAQDLGLPLDATLRVEGPDGKVLISSIDQGAQADPGVSWTAAADGPHQIIVEDQFHRGGPHHHYLLEIGLPTPTYAVTLPERKPVLLEAGKTVGVKINVKPLLGFKGPLVARVSGLPAGVHAADVAVPVKGGDIEIKLQAASNAPAATQPITFQVWTTAEPATQVTADYPLHGEEVRGTTLKDRASWLWLRVR